MPVEILMVTENINNPGVLADLVASNLRLKIEEAHRCSRRRSPSRGLPWSATSSPASCSWRDAGEDPEPGEGGDVQEPAEYFLREQMKAIKQETGRHRREIRGGRRPEGKIEAAGMPEEVKKERRSSSAAWRGCTPDSDESFRAWRTYLDWMVELPWKKETRITSASGRRKEILERGPPRPREGQGADSRQYLSVRKLKDKMKGPILCFVGPPGVGKTSLGKSIARAMERSSSACPFGGIRDEAEIAATAGRTWGRFPGASSRG